MSGELEFRYRRLDLAERKGVLGELKRALEEEEDIVFAYVHGGFVSREVFRDIDIAIWLINPNKAFEYSVNFPVALESKLHLPLPVDIQVINEAPLPFQYKVLTEGRLLFSKDEGLRWRIIDKVTLLYLDLMILVESVK